MTNNCKSMYSFIPALVIFNVLCLSVATANIVRESALNHEASTHDKVEEVILSKKDKVEEVQSSTNTATYQAWVGVLSRVAQEVVKRSGEDSAAMATNVTQVVDQWTDMSSLNMRVSLNMKNTISIFLVFT